MVYAQEITERFPWFADSEVNAGSFTTTSSQPHYGYWLMPNTQNSSVTWGISMREGTYTIIQLCIKSATQGKVHFTNNGGADLVATDQYSAGTTYGVLITSTGLALVVGTLTITSASKNGSSSGYFLVETFIRLIRTGA